MPLLALHPATPLDAVPDLVPPVPPAPATPPGRRAAAAPRAVPAPRPRRVRRQQAGYDQFGFPVGAYIEEGAAATVVYIVKKTGIFLAGARQQQVFLAGACQQQVFLAGVQAAQAKGEG